MRFIFLMMAITVSMAVIVPGSVVAWEGPGKGGQKNETDKPTYPRDLTKKTPAEKGAPNQSTEQGNKSGTK